MRVELDSCWEGQGKGEGKAGEEEGSLLDDRRCNDLTRPTPCCESVKNDNLILRNGRLEVSFAIKHGESQ